MLWTLHTLYIRRGAPVHYLNTMNIVERITILKIKDSKGTHTDFWRNLINGATKEIIFGD